MFFRNLSRKNLKNHIKPTNLRKEKDSLPEKIPYLLKYNFGRASLKASLTIEAALVLPAFVYLMTGLLGFMNVMGSAGALTEGLSCTAKQMAVYAYAAESAGGPQGVLKGGLSAAYAKAQIKKQKGIPEGISMGYSSFLKKDDLIDLVASYRIRSPVPMFSFGKPRILQRGCVRAWTGRDFREEAGNDSGSSGERVYVAEHGVVYHKNPNCTHLRLSVRAVPASGTESLRNRYGAKYYACSCCKNGTGAAVYITDTGNRYHAGKECSGLKRTVHSEELSDVDHLPPCSKCGG